jgi:cytochrome P450
MLQRWKNSAGKIKLAPELIKLLSEVSARLLAGGVSLEEGFGLRVIQLIAEFQKNPLGKAYKETRTYVFTTVESMLVDAQGKSMGILSIYADEVAAGRIPMQEAVAEVVGFFNAAVETTGNLLSWLIYFLSGDSVRWEKAQREVAEIFGGRAEIDAQDLRKFVYLKQCVEEAARLAPAAWRQLRKVATKNTIVTVDGKSYHLPVHTQIFDLVNFIQRDPAIWGVDADSFNPEKHMTDEFIASIPKGSYSPWSQGIHMCPGITKSKMDMMLILAHVLHAFTRVEFEEALEPVLGPVLAFPHQAEMQLVS